MTHAELLAPAGDFATALTAFESGADAVYCGLADFSARAFAQNFSQEELSRLMAYARKNGKKVYVTFNTLLDEDQLDGALEQLAQLDDLRPDGIIVQDLGVARLCRRHFPALVLHASTQLVAHNLEGVLALKELGFVRVVLARELSLAEITAIARKCGELELEVFIHGALCYSLSGLCLFGAMEKGRSGNRGKCPYCCRLPYTDEAGHKTLPFSMKDLRVGEDVRKLVDAGVVSLKIEGRMKSPIYVGSVVQYYRQILDGTPRRLAPADLETVFSRRTTELYLNGTPTERPIDPKSLGHLGTPIGDVKRVTKDREGLLWLRFHTTRALEKHDGLQFDATDENGKHFGMGIVEMRQAISRRPVFEVNAGVDVEVLVNEDLAAALRPGMKIYCSMSNAVRRLVPTPSFRPSDYAGGHPLTLRVEITPTQVSCSTTLDGCAQPIACRVNGDFPLAQNPGKTAEGVRKAFSKLGGTDYSLAALEVVDDQQRYVPMSTLNDLRRDLVEALDEARMQMRRAKIDSAMADDELTPLGVLPVRHELRLRVDQTPPSGSFDEVILALTGDTTLLPPWAEEEKMRIRLALPVYTSEIDFQRLRVTVKRFVRAGFLKWECADLATLRLLKEVGVTDLSADWTLYAFNSRALAELASLGVRRFVASPENTRENLQYLAESGSDISFLTQQSTPLFISLTEPESQTELAVFRAGKLWVTTKKVPRTFEPPPDVSTRVDLSWDPPI